jgi:recombination protein RecA
LKFYASVRIDIRRIETLKVGAEMIGNRVRAKIVKNKVAPPFKEAQFDIMFGQGISREGSLLDVGVDHGIVRKAGAWFTYDEIQLGQGKENSKRFLRENADIALQLETDVFKAVGLIESEETPEEELVDESEDTPSEK